MCITKRPKWFFFWVSWAPKVLIVTVSLLFWTCTPVQCLRYKKKKISHLILRGLDCWETIIVIIFLYFWFKREIFQKENNRFNHLNEGHESTRFVCKVANKTQCKSFMSVTVFSLRICSIFEIQNLFHYTSKFSSFLTYHNYSQTPSSHSNIN